jgi:hypothetical protein
VFVIPFRPAVAANAPIAALYTCSEFISGWVRRKRAGDSEIWGVFVKAFGTRMRNGFLFFVRAVRACVSFINISLETDFVASFSISRVLLQPTGLQSGENA